LNIIYQVYKSGNQDDDKILLFGFRGDIAYLWNHSEYIQIFSADTKGGNRPIRMITRSKNGINGEQVDP
jgi:hypothetical protein